MDGERLSELRKDYGLTQKQLAARLFVSLQTISSYERGLTTPDDALKIRIAQFFNVSVDYLMGYEGPGKLPAQPQIVFLGNIPPKAKQETEAFLHYLIEKYHFHDK